MRTSIGIIVTLVLLLMGAPAPAQEAELTRPTLLLQEVLKGMPRGDRQEVRVITANFKPGDKTVFHTHRFPVTVYVLEGAFTLEMEGRAPVTIKAGEAFTVPSGVVHEASAGRVPTKLLATYIVEKGKPLRTAVQ